MSELIKNFGIDWRLLAAQAVNFFVLLFVLWRFAYKPILTLLRKRREDIENGIRASQEAQERLKRVEELGEEKLTEARRHALTIVSQAEALGRIRKEEIVREATRKGETVITQARRAAGEEKAKAQEEIYAGAEDLIREGISRVLGHLPPETRDKKLIRAALQELKSAHRT